MGAKIIWTAEQDATLCRMFAEGATDVEIAAAVGRTKKAVKIHRLSLGLFKPTGTRTRGAPEDFAQFCTETNDKLVKRYGVSSKLIARWRKEIGVTVYHNRWTTGNVVLKPGLPKRRSRPAQFVAPRIAQPMLADNTLAGRAADHLRRRGFIPVCHMRTIDPKADPNVWKAGRLSLTSGDLIDLAKAKGFDGEGWATI